MGAVKNMLWELCEQITEIWDEQDDLFQLYCDGVITADVLRAMAHEAKVKQDAQEQQQGQ